MKKVLLSIGLIAFVATMAGCAQGPAAEGMAVAKKACECQKLSEDDTKSVEYEACLKEWDEMNNTAHEKYENDETKLKEFIEGLESYKCD